MKNGYTRFPKKGNCVTRVFSKKEILVNFGRNLYYDA